MRNANEKASFSKFYIPFHIENKIYTAMEIDKKHSVLKNNGRV